MVAARAMNRRAHPLYGAYVIGRHWYFVILDNTTYSESLAYDATREDITTIFGVLCHTKEIIERLITESV